MADPASGMVRRDEYRLDVKTLAGHGRMLIVPIKESYTMKDSRKYIEVPVLTVSEAARFIGVGKKVIYQLVEFDEIRAMREHGKVMIDRSSLEAFHNSGKRP